MCSWPRCWRTWTVGFGKARRCHAPRVVRKGTGVVRDPNTGNLVGGVRPPWVVVPAASYMTEAETHCGLVYDTKVPYSAPQLRALYGNFAAYRRQFERAKLEVIQMVPNAPEGP